MTRPLLDHTTVSALADAHPMAESQKSSPAMRKAQSPLLSIQYLRAFAALLVVFHHARNPERWLFNPIADVNFGARGVDIFFVISGFIMYVAARQEPPLEFLRRRAVRVLPLYWIATLAMVGIGLSHGEIFSRLSILLSLLLIPFHNPTHQGQIWPLLVPGWTLMYEMFFYLLFALGLARGRVVSTVTIAIVALVALGVATRPNNAVVATYTNPLMLEFLAGIGLAKVREYFEMRHLWVLLPAGVIALPVLDGLHLPSIVGGFIPAVAIVGGALGCEARFTVPRLSFAKRLGDASYSIYLVHTIMMSATNARVAALPLAGWAQLATLIIVTLVGAAIVGIVVHYLVEKPLLRLLMRVTTPTEPSRAHNRVPN